MKFKSQNWKSNIEKIIKIEEPKLNFLQKILGCFSKKSPLSETHLESRDFIFCLAKTEYDPKIECHYIILFALYRKITGEKSCISSGTHWKDIGFQSDLPARDIRGSGMLGPLAALYFIEKQENGIESMWDYSKDPEKNFPLMVSIFEKVLMAMKLLRDGSIN